MIPTTITDQEYHDFSHFLESQCGIALGNNKQYLVCSRLRLLVNKYRFESFSSLLKSVICGGNVELERAVIEAMVTNETLWFRDDYPFTLLADVLIPELARHNRPIKIWSAASSSGQEPYSIAMTILENQLKSQSAFCDVSIVATDISSEMLDICRAGIYDEMTLKRGLSSERRHMFFENVDNDRMKIKDCVKKLVHFRSKNLVDDDVFLGRFDIIFCRNVMIYFSPSVKAKVLNSLINSLNPGGYLLLGASESLTGFSDRFEMVQCHPGIVYKLKPKV